MHQRLFELLSFFAPFAGLTTLIYYQASNVVTLNTIQMINFSFFIFQTLLITPFAILFALKFKQHHEQILRKINSHIPLYLRFFVFLLSITLCLFAYIIIFYEYFVNMRSEAGMWSIELNVFISITNYIFFAKSLRLEIVTTMFKYTVYIIMSIMIIIFLAHMAVMTMKAIYLPEFCLEICMILVFCNCWWVQTPTALRVLMIIADVIAIEELSRNLVYKSPPVGVFVARIIVILLVAVHGGCKVWEFGKDVKRCVGEFYEDEGKDVPLSNVMISQIPLVEFKRKVENNVEDNVNNVGVVGVQKSIKQNKNGVMEESMCDIVDSDSCAICTMKMEENSFVYDIPCKHMFHSECLGKWLQVRNSCPTCRKQAI